jgi:hypothetical protein
MDDLTEIMSLLRTSGHLYAWLELSAPFAFEFQGYKGICLSRPRSCFLGADQEPLAERGVELLSAGLDEVPGIDKDIYAVMAAQTDLV